MLLSNFFCTFAFPVSVYFFIFSLKNKNALFLIISFFRTYKINISTLNRIFKAVIFVTNIFLYMIWSNPDRFVPYESAEPFGFHRQLCWNTSVSPTDFILLQLISNAIMTSLTNILIQMTKEVLALGMRIPICKGVLYDESCKARQ